MKVSSASLAEAYARGQEKAAQTKAISLEAVIKDQIAGLRSAYPAIAGMDISAELLKLDHERMANPPDTTKFPETKGLPDLLREERRGFMDACGGNELLLAHAYTWQFFYSRRINTRYLPGVLQRCDGCTAVFIPNSTEGGPLYGRNWDITLNPWARSLMEPPRKAADGKRVMWIKGVSCNLFLDDEPREIFPVDPFLLLPAECTAHASDAAEFLYRYRDFWGPGNNILVDRNHDSVAIEKANCRMGVRKSDNGASAGTAMSFVIPEIEKYIGFNLDCIVPDESMLAALPSAHAPR